MTKRFNKFMLLALALVMVLGIALPGLAASKAADFSVYHIKKNKLSMSDAGFIKEDCEITKTESGYHFILYTQPVEKDMGIFGVYEADITAIKFQYNGNEIVATPKGSKPACNQEGESVPVYFEADVPDSYIQSGEFGFAHKVNIEFDTNIANTGLLGIIGDAMMNPKARLCFN